MNRYERNNVIIVTLVSLLFITVSAVIYIVYLKEEPPKEKKDSIFVKVEDDKIIKELTDTIDKNNLIEIAQLERTIDNINSLTSTQKLSIAFNKVLNDIEDPYTFGVDTKLIDEYFKNTYLTTMYWNKEDINCTCDKKLYLYDKETDKYIYNTEHLGHGFINVSPFYKKVLDVSKKNDTYVIEMSYVWSTYGDLFGYTNIGYSSYNDTINDTNKLFEIEVPEDETETNVDYYAINEIEKNYDNYKDKLHSYIYTFEKHDDKYLLVSFRFER